MRYAVLAGRVGDKLTVVARFETKFEAIDYIMIVSDHWFTDGDAGYAEVRDGESQDAVVYRMGVLCP